MVVPQSVTERAVFVDAGPFVGSMNNNDQWHAPAIEGFRRLAREHRPLISTNLVISEAYALLLHRLGAMPAQTWLGSLGSIRVVYQEPRHMSSVREVLMSRADQEYSLADAFSFVVMREQGITTAFTFDQHFALEGFRRFP